MNIDLLVYLASKWAREQVPAWRGEVRALPEVVLISEESPVWDELAVPGEPIPFGAYVPEENRLYLDPGIDEFDLGCTLLHEMVHWAQSRALPEVEAEAEAEGAVIAFVKRHGLSERSCLQDFIDIF